MEISPVAESMANGLSSATKYVSVSPASGSVPAAVAMTVPAAVFSATFTEVPSSNESDGPSLTLVTLMSSVWDVESPSASVTVTSTEVGMLSPSKSKTDASLDGDFTGSRINGERAVVCHGIGQCVARVGIGPCCGGNDGSGRGVLCHVHGSAFIK